MSSKNFLLDLLAIPSPTFKEEKKADFLQGWCKSNLSMFNLNRMGNNIILDCKTNGAHTLGFVGHIDTVPDFFDPFEKEGKVYGSGASDMQAGLASMLCFINKYQHQLLEIYSIKVIIYDKEEGTSLKQNGLNELIQHDQLFFDDIDLAIVAEPTNNAIQLGCVGSIHYTINVFGKAAHSARPWNGENALYKALPLIQKISSFEPNKQTLFDVDFFDVLDITESKTTEGRTTVPDVWTANINYRFSPVYSLEQAKQFVIDFVDSVGLNFFDLNCRDAVDAGHVVEHALLHDMTAKNLTEIQAKQAWTDVAQLTGLGICAINFGPGRQDQAHQQNEYVVVEDMVNYELMLKQYFLGGS